MAARLRLQPHLTPERIRERFEKSRDVVLRSHWQVIWLVSQERRSEDIAQVSGYTVFWVRKLVRRYNEGGPDALGDGRHHNPGQAPLLDGAALAALERALEGPPPGGGQWSGPKVAVWMAERLGRPVGNQRGWEYLRKLQFAPLRPRPRHTAADEEAQRCFEGRDSAPPGG